MTNVALSAMFGATPPAGYESLYFDRNDRQLHGGVRKYLGRRTPDKIPSSYMDELDYQEPLAFEFLIYVAPESVWRTDMQRFHERFRSCSSDARLLRFSKSHGWIASYAGAGDDLMWLWNRSTKFSKTFESFVVTRRRSLCSPITE